MLTATKSWPTVQKMPMQRVTFSYTKAKVCNILHLPSSHVLRKQRRKRQTIIDMI